MYKSLIFLLTLLNSVATFAAPAIYEFLPNQPFTTSVTANNNAMQCLITYPSTTKQSLKVYVLAGNVVVNGTSLKQGNTLVITPANHQVVPLTFYQGSQTQFTNMGQYKMVASCN